MKVYTITKLRTFEFSAPTVEVFNFAVKDEAEQKFFHLVCELSAQYVENDDAPGAWKRQQIDANRVQIFDEWSSGDGFDIELHETIL